MPPAPLWIIILPLPLIEMSAIVSSQSLTVISPGARDITVQRADPAAVNIHAAEAGYVDLQDGCLEAVRG